MVSILTATMGEGCKKLETFCCVFCRRKVNLPLADFDNFKNHMERVHSVFYQFEMLFACNFLDKDDQAEMMEKVKLKWNKMSNESENPDLNETDALEEFRNKMAGYKVTKEAQRVSKKQTSPKTFVSSVDKDSVITISSLVEAKLVDPELHSCKNCDYKTKSKCSLNGLSDIHHLDIHHLRHSSPPY